MSGIRRFSEFADEPVGLDGEKVTIDRALNCEMVVTGYRLLTTKYPGKNKSGNALQLQFKILVPGAEIETVQPNILFTGSDVLIEQIQKYAEHIPFYAKIVKINRHYTFQ